MLLTIKDLSEQLQIKRSTRYLWAQQGRIPCLKLNGLVRFDPVAIGEWVKSSSVRQPALLPDRFGKRDPSELGVMIARAKRAVYYSRSRGNQTKIKPYRKGGSGWGCIDEEQSGG